MTNQSFNYIEDYIEYIGGYSPLFGSFLLGGTSTLSLARYDVNIIDSLCNQTMNKSLGFTEKQAELAKTIVYKYRKQLEKRGIIIPETLNKFRLPIRKISNTHSVEIDRENFSFVLRFPYNADLITKLRNLKTSEELSASFNYDKKVWTMPITEYSLNFIKVVFNETYFTYDPEILELYDQLLEVEKQDHNIELREIDGNLTISNAPQSLTEYIDNTIGGINKENFFKLVDLSTTLGYTISDSCVQQFTSTYTNDLLQKLALKKTIKIKLNEFNFDTIIEYMTISGRYPAYAYLSSFKNLHRFKHEHIDHLGSSWPDSNVPVKLFISQTPILIGVRKNTMLKMAEKIIIIEHETM